MLAARILASPGWNPYSLPALVRVDSKPKPHAAKITAPHAQPEYLISPGKSMHSAFPGGGGFETKALSRKDYRTTCWQPECEFSGGNPYILPPPVGVDLRPKPEAGKTTGPHAGSICSTASIFSHMRFYNRLGHLMGIFFVLFACIKSDFLSVCSNTCAYILHTQI